MESVAAKRHRGAAAAYEQTLAAEREDWVRQYLPLVRRIAHRMMVRLPASVEVEDLIQAGTLGLIDAARRFEPGHGAQFETYATQRIRGAILDELRQHDWLPRNTRRSMRRIEEAIATLEQRLGREPSEQEIADHLELPLARYQEQLQQARGHQIVYYDDLVGEEGESFLERCDAGCEENVLERLIDEERRAALARAIAGLPEREKLVMSLYYERELTLREIGEVLGVTESRVCQLHTQAIARLRARLRARS
jgi:RNA polymerase sigma factor for flagellar operon FliA